MEVVINVPQKFEITKLVCKARVRYPEDSGISYDGEHWEDDDEINPKMPCIVKEGKDFYWVIEIDPEDGKIMNWTQGMYGSTAYKTCDEFECYVYSHDKQLLHYDGYVPNFMSIDDIGYGDYIYVTIDNNGMINGWIFNQDDFNEMVDQNL